MVDVSETKKFNNVNVDIYSFVYCLLCFLKHPPLFYVLTTILKILCSKYIQY